MTDQNKKNPQPSSQDELPVGSAGVERLISANEHLTLATLRAQQQADDADFRYRDLVEGVDAIVWEASAVPWRFTFVSQRAEKIMGYPLSQWMNMSEFVKQMVYPDDRDAVVRACDSQASTSADFRLQFRMVSSTEQILWVALIARYTNDSDHPGQYRGLLVNIEDSIRAETLEKLVTAQTSKLVNQQEHLRALATELNLSEHRMRTKMATELHDHLAQMLALARLKLGQARHIKMVPGACLNYIEQSEDVLSQCLTYTRTLVAELSPPVLHEFGLPAALTWLARQMRRYDLVVSCEFPPSAPWVISEDESVLLFQSARELLINVGKHANTGNALMRLEYKENILRLSVQDEGRGCDTALLTNSDPGQASKFGLFSIRERMRAHGGEFDITSIPGKGTKTILMLPLPGHPAVDEKPSYREKQALSRSSADTASSSPLPPRGPQTVIKVLIVDDHAMLRESLHSMVDSHEHLHVIGEASNGVEALEEVRALHPDVVVMDINMPRMNGLEAAKLIKREFPRVGIVGLSIHDSEEMVETMAAAGISSYVRKDNAAKTLCPAIDAAFSQHTDESGPELNN